MFQNAGRSEEEEGVVIAHEMVQRLRGMVAGVYLHAPFGTGQLAMELAEAAGFAAVSLKPALH